MDAVARDLLKLLADTYPVWAKSLSKDKTYKISVCNSYVKLLEPTITQAHIAKLKDWLNSSTNAQFRKWPPQPLELKDLLRSMSAECKMPPVIEMPDKQDLAFNVSWLVARCLTTMNPDKFFSDQNAHLKEKVFEIIKQFKENPRMDDKERIELLR